MALRINTGGLFRCCIEAVDTHVSEGGSEEEGTVVTCPHCHEKVAVKHGLWKWQHENYLKDGISTKVVNFEGNP